MNVEDKNLHEFLKTYNYTNVNDEKVFGFNGELFVEARPGATQEELTNIAENLVENECYAAL